MHHSLLGFRLKLVILKLAVLRGVCPSWRCSKETAEPD
jgi:hypothetical protein